MPAQWRTQRDAVVPGRRQLELHPDAAVLKLLLREQIAALLRLAGDRPILHLVTIDRALPVAQVLPVDLLHETLGIAARQLLVRFLGRDLAQENIPPANLTPMRLELDRPLRRHRVL